MQLRDTSLFCIRYQGANQVWAYVSLLPILGAVFQAGEFWQSRCAPASPFPPAVAVAFDARMDRRMAARTTCRCAVHACVTTAPQAAGRVGVCVCNNKILNTS